jgi:hypothetical protein
MFLPKRDIIPPDPMLPTSSDKRNECLLGPDGYCIRIKMLVSKRQSSSSKEVSPA